MSQSRSLHRRLDEVVQSRPAHVRQLVVISPEDWPPEILAAWDHACDKDDRVTQATLIRQQTGELVQFDDVLPIRIIELRTTPDGPD